MFRLTKLTIQDFGPFVGKHSVELPENGLSLIRGKVLETGDGSGAGKSYLLNAISYVLGFCPFPATDLQSWYTEDPPQASLEILTDKGKLTLTRKKGLSLKADFLPEKEYKGKAAEAQLDAIFGMDKKLRQQATYRPQGTPGLFLEMDDAEKKSFLAKVLDLEKYEKIAEQASRAASKLEQDCHFKENVYNVQLESYVKAHKRLEEHVYPDNLDKLNEQKASVSKQLDELRTKKSTLNIQIETVRKSNNNELEAVLSTVRTKVSQVNSRGESVEMSALKAELLKQQQRLEKCRKYDQDKKLEVQKQRDALKYQLKEIETQHIIETAARTSRFDSDLNECRSEIHRLVGAETRLKSLEKDLQKLNDQKCPTCGQMWDDSAAQIGCTQILIEAAKSDITLLKSYQASFEQLSADKEKYVCASEIELADKLASKKAELSAIKDPEPHPVGAQVQTKIVELTKNIKDLEVSDRTKKQKDLEAIFAEEKDIKSQFRLKLDNEVEELQVELFGIETDVTKNNAELVKIGNEIAYVNKEMAVHAELKKSFEDALASMEKSYNELEEIRGQMALESDVAALVGYKGFLGVIFSDVLDEIAAQTNDILSKVANVRHLTMDFETEKEASSSGNVTVRITPVIYSKGRKVSYKGGISGGMRTAVQLAVDLAVGNVVSSRTSSYPGFIILDEALDGLGSISKESSLEMLSSVAGDRLVLVVDHDSSFINLFNQVIEIDQMNGISRIV